MGLRVGREGVISERDGRLHVRTDMEAGELRRQLARWEPWRHEIHFSNGVSTTDCRTTTPFAKFPLSKWFIFRKHIDPERLRGGRALDIGFNCGYNALYLASEYDMEVVGIDVTTRHVEVAEFLRGLTGLDRTRFELADANTYRSDEPFDLVLHFGTLYHLRHPFLSLENTVHNLKPGGILALETHTFLDGADECTCLFLPGTHMGDDSNWWALGKTAVVGMLEACGMTDVEVIFSWSNPEVLGGTQFERTCYYARKPT